MSIAYIAFTVIAILMTEGATITIIIWGSALVAGWAGMLLKVMRVYAWWLLLGLMLFNLAYFALGPGGVLTGTGIGLTGFDLTLLTFWNGIPLAVLLTDRPGQWKKEPDISA